MTFINNRKNIEDHLPSGNWGDKIWVDPRWAETKTVVIKNWTMELKKVYDHAYWKTEAKKYKLRRRNYTLKVNQAYITLAHTVKSKRKWFRLIEPSIITEISIKLQTVQKIKTTSMVTNIVVCSRNIH